MRLEYNNDYISIEKFNPVELPDFVVLTGVNGSGKSHLLQAINNKKVVFSDFDDANIVFFNYETFKLENESSFNAHQLSAETESAWSFHEQQVKNNAAAWRNDIGEEYESIKSRCKNEEKSIWSINTAKIKEYKKT